MKKLFALVVMLVAVTMSSFAKDLTKEQMAIRLDVVKYLSKEGFQPKIDKDGDVTFSKDDRTYFVIINENWSEPYLITLYKEYSYEENGLYTKKNIESCISAVATHRVVKLYCMADSYTFRADIFCKNAEVFKNSFYSLMEEFEEARKHVVTNLNSGLGGMDVTGNMEGVFEKAMEFYRNDEYDKSFPLFKILAESGYSKAYGYMGLAYELGEGTSTDNVLMIKNYEKAIESGFNWCAYRLGNYYYNNADYAKAMTNYIKCGANENVFRSEAFYKAGTMHEKGEGTDKNLTQAIMCYRKSVQYSTDMECDARQALVRLGEVVDKREDFVDATKTMLMGLSVQEMYETGYEYEQGLNSRYVSLPKAYAFYKAAADRDYTKAYTKMGEIYVSKYYPFNDKATSDKYYKKAFKIYKQKESSDGEACYELGRMYQNGYGVATDKEQAKFYYKSGALLGDKNASWRFGLLCKDEMEYPEAYKFFLKAAEKGQGMAMYELAKLYEEGLGVTMSREKAIEWYTKCVNSNYVARSDARKALRRLGAIEEKD